MQTFLQPMLDDLLDERVLVGTSRACVESLRHAALSTLGELVGSVRKTMASAQLSRSIALFGGISYEAGLPVTTRSMCLRVLLALVEPVYMQVRGCACAYTSVCFCTCLYEVVCACVYLCNITLCGMRNRASEPQTYVCTLL